MSHKNLLTLDEQEINIIQELWEVGGTNSIVRSITRYKQAPASLLLSNTSGTSSECHLIRLLNLEADTQYRVFVFGYSDTDETIFGVRGVGRLRRYTTEWQVFRPLWRLRRYE